MYGRSRFAQGFPKNFMPCGFWLPHCRFSSWYPQKSSRDPPLLRIPLRKTPFATGHPPWGECVWRKIIPIIENQTNKTKHIKDNKQQLTHDNTQ